MTTYREGQADHIRANIDWITLAEADGATLFDDRKAGSTYAAWRWRGKREDDCGDYRTKKLAAEMYCATNDVGP